MKKIIFLALILMLLPAVSEAAVKKPVHCGPKQAKVFGKCMPKNRIPVFKDRTPGVSANA